MKKRKKLTQHDRAARFAVRTCRLEKFIHGGEPVVVITPKLRELIRGYMTWSWANGYAAGRADAKKATTK